MDEEEIDEDAPKPKFPGKMFINQGIRNITLRQFDKAIKCFDAVLEHEPNNEKVLKLKADCYINLGNFELVKTLAEIILKLNSKSADALKLKGKALFLTGDFENSFLTHRKVKKAAVDKTDENICKTAINNSLSKDIGMCLGWKDVNEIEKLMMKTNAGEYKQCARRIFRKKPPAFMGEIQFLEKLISDKSLGKTLIPGLKPVIPKCKKLLEFAKDRYNFKKVLYPKYKQSACPTGDDVITYASIKPQAYTLSICKTSITSETAYSIRDIPYKPFEDIKHISKFRRYVVPPDALDNTEDLTFPGKSPEEEISGDSSERTVETFYVSGSSFRLPTTSQAGYSGKEFDEELEKDSCSFCSCCFRKCKTK